MKTVRDILLLSAEYLQKKGIEQPRRQAEELLCDYLTMDRMTLYLNFDRPLNEDEVSGFRVRLKRRGDGEPIQYIHGKVEFYHCTFEINSAVLIPRQETEILVDKIVKILEKKDLKGKHLWDLCCGSGCIGITLKKKFPELTVTLADLSSQALEIAKKNAKLNGVEVHFVQGDLLTPFLGKKTDFFVCNPPYISEGAYKKLDREVKDFEPKMALTGGPIGSEFYERLAKELPLYLHPHGLVAFEMGFDQEEIVTNLFKNSFWKNFWIEKDYAGHPRFFFLENE